MKFAVVYEQTPRNWAAYVPDLPGCVATGATRDEVERRIREAIEMHLGAMRDAAQVIPLPTTTVGSVELG